MNANYDFNAWLIATLAETKWYKNKENKSKRTNPSDITSCSIEFRLIKHHKTESSDVHCSRNNNDM